MNTLKFKGNFGALELSIEGNVANGKYQENGTLSGAYNDNIFKGVWHNKGLSGLIEFSIIDGKLDGRWKKGVEPGPMKSKWEGTIIELKKIENIISKIETEVIKEDNLALNNIPIIEDNNLNKPLPNSILDKNFKCILLNSITNRNEELYNELKKIFDEDEDWYAEENGAEIYSEILNIISENEIKNKKSNNSSNINNSINDEEIVKQNYDNGDKFEGVLLKGKRNGKGKYTFADGDFEDGIFEAGKFLKGTVQRTNSNGYKYIGEWENGNRHGEGKLYDPNNIIIKSGVFVNGVSSQDYIDWKKDVVLYGKKNGYSTLLGNILSVNKRINFNDLKNEIEDLYKLEKHKIIVEKCIRFIEKDDIFLNIEEASCHLIKSIDKLHSDKKNLIELIYKAYVKFPNNETIKVFKVKYMMLDIFEFDKKATLGKSSNNNDYYKEDNTTTYGAGTYARPLSLTYDRESKEIIELYLRIISLTKKIEYEDKDLKVKINSIEDKLNLTLKFHESTQKSREQSRRENEINDAISRKNEINTEINKKLKPQESSNQGTSFEITYEVKLKQEAGFFNTISAQKNAIESGKGFLNAMSTSSKKGGYRERSIRIKHNKNSLSNTEAKNYITQNDSDVLKGVAGSSTINILRIKKWNGNNYV